MADYKIGKLVFEIEANTQKAIKSLNELSNSLNKIQTANLNEVQKKLNEIGNLNFKNLTIGLVPLEQIDAKKLSSVVRVLKSISSFNLNNVDIATLGTQIQQVMATVDPFLTRIESASPALKDFVRSFDISKINSDLSIADAKLQNILLKNEKINTQIKKEGYNTEKAKVQLEKANLQLDKTKNKVNEINKANNNYRTRGLLHTLFSIGKVYWAINYARRMATSIAKIFTTAIDFNEVLNKFQVSMGEFYDDSVKFVDQLTKAFNLSTASIMNYMSTFKNMLDALGNIGGADTYELSQTLTRMAIDYASLFNVEIDKAMQQFQAVLSGQIRSIRTTAGYDVSESTIYNIYKSLGGTKTSRQLDQTEKRLLRIIALQRQMERTGAVNDFAKTINNAANMLKELGETMKEAARWFAQLAMNYLEPLIEKTLGFAMALRDVLEALNKANGYVYEDFGSGGLFGEVEESATNAEDAVNSLKRNLLGLDKLNILGSSSATGTTQEDYSLLLNAVKGYTSTLDNVQSKASAIRDRIMEWLGFTKNANGEWEKTGDRLDDLKEKIKSIFEVIVGFGLTLKISEFISSLGTIGDKIGLIGTAIGKIGIGKLGIITTLVVSAVKAFEDLWNDEHSQFSDNMKRNFADIGENVSDIVGDITTIFDDLTSIIAECMKPLIEEYLPKILSIVDLVLGKVKDIFDKFAIAIDGLRAIFDKDYEPKSIEAQNFKFFWEQFGFKIPEAKDFTFASTGGGLTSEQYNEMLENENKIKKWLSELWEKLGYGKTVPHFASGGVVTKPTMAMVGEYSGANSNPEIIAPENKIRGIFAESMLPLVRAIVNGDERLINAVNDLADRPVELNGRKVSENIFDDLQDVAIRKGKMLYNV